LPNRITVAKHKMFINYLTPVINAICFGALLFNFLACCCIRLGNLIKAVHTCTDHN
jgi:hypothetical protein